MSNVHQGFDRLKEVAVMCRQGKSIYTVNT